MGKKSFSSLQLLGVVAAPPFGRDKAATLAEPEIDRNIETPQNTYVGGEITMILLGS